MKVSLLSLSPPLFLSRQVATCAHFGENKAARRKALKGRRRRRRRALLQEREREREGTELQRFVACIEKTKSLYHYNSSALQDGAPYAIVVIYFSKVHVKKLSQSIVETV